MYIEIGQACKRSAGAQTFKVVPDTGRSNLWVPAADSALCEQHPGKCYDSKQSCTEKLLGKRVSFKYGDGTRGNGSVIRELVKVGDIAVRDQVMIQVDEMVPSTGLRVSDGVMGLAHHFRDKHHNKSARSFMSRLFDEHPGIPRMFSFRLAPLSGVSKIVFGEPEVEKYATEDFVYGKKIYMSDTNLWLTSVYSIGFSNTGVESKFEHGDQVRGAAALVDSGTSLILLKPAIWDVVVPSLQKHFGSCNITAGGLMFCSCHRQLKNIPSLVINLIDEHENERPLCVPAEEYIQKYADPASISKAVCIISIERGDSKQPFPIVFGMTFMRTFYTNFDIELHRIGFARSKLSSMPAGAVCTVHTSSEKVTWIATTGLVGLAIAFALYTCCCGDVAACCGYPTCKASDPCDNADVKSKGVHAYSYDSMCCDITEQSPLNITEVEVKELETPNIADNAVSMSAAMIGENTFEVKDALTRLAVSGASQQSPPWHDFRDSVRRKLAPKSDPSSDT
jgi:hypothetical protein